MLITLAFVNVARAGDVDKQRFDPFYRDIQPLLNAKCVSCHGPDEQEADLRLDSLAAAQKGGDSGPAIVLGDAEGSLLLRAIRHEDDVAEMPPKEKLPDKTIKAVATWINAGAPWPRSVMVLFDDEVPFVAALSKGKASIRVEHEDRASGRIAVAVSPRERFSEQITGWKFAICENPLLGEYRFLQFAWKKTGGGGAMIEVANAGHWPDAKAAPGR
jgi:hypothetical protein